MSTHSQDRLPGISDAAIPLQGRQGSQAGAVVPAPELAASIAAARQLGAEYDAAVAESLAARLDEAVERRVSERISQERTAARAQALVPPRPALSPALAIASLFAAVPLLPIAYNGAGVAGAALTGAVLLVLNIVYFAFAVRN